MLKIISPVQTIDELKFIKQNNPSTDILPLDLDTLLFCRKHKLSYVNLLDYSCKELHIEIIHETDSILKKLNINNHPSAFEKEFVAVCRFFLHQLFFVKLILQRIIEQNQNVKFHVSGFEKKENILYSNQNYQISKLVRRFFPDRTIQVKDFKKKENYSKKLITFSFKKNTDCDLLLHSLGYNFSRVSAAAKNLGFQVGALHFGSVSWRQRAAYIWCGVKPIEIFPSKFSQESPDLLSWLDDLNDIEGDLLRERIEEALPALNIEFSKCLVVKEILEKIRPRLTASFGTRGVLGAILDVGNSYTTSVCIPHGTVTARRLDQDKSYRATIAEAVFTGQTEWLALQSKIAQEAYQDLKPSGQAYLGGNLIFNEAIRPPNKNIILYAVTQKNFFNMQFYGVEAYYEFFSNMRILENVQSNIDFSIVVKLHPAARMLKSLLEDEFPELSFATDNLQNLLSKSLVTISFSSSVIEDSLYSQVPVILFDPWNRYQHCWAESDTSKENKAIYYVTAITDLISAIQTVKESSFIDFEEYTMPGSSEDNLKNLLETLL